MNQTANTQNTLPAEIVTSVAALMGDALQKVSIATDFSIAEQADAEVAGTQLSAIAKALKAIDEERLGHTRPLDAQKKQIMAEYAKPVEKLEQADKLLRDEMKRWTLAEQRRVAEAQRIENERIAKEQREAQEAADREAQRLQGLKTPAAIERSTQRLEDLQAKVTDTQVMAPVVQEAQKVGGFGLRDKWELVVEDNALEQLIEAITGAKIQRRDLLQYLSVNEKHAGGIVRAMKANFNGQVPGMRAVNNPSTTVR